MKFFLMIVFFIQNLFAQNKISEELKQKINETFQIYHAGVVSGNFDQMKKVISPQFIKEFGDEKSYRKQLKEAKDLFINSKIVVHQIVESRGKKGVVFAEVAIETPKGSKQDNSPIWFMLEEVEPQGKSNYFLVIKFVNDFDPSPDIK